MKYKNGLIAGAFDIIHPGYIYMFKRAKFDCQQLTIALHENPKLERTYKLKPILPLEDRKLIIESIKYVDNVIVYKKESELIEVLGSGKYDLRILGSDYIGKSHSGDYLGIPVLYTERCHGYSTTMLKEMIYEQVLSIKK